jgi:hypothetical protein
MQQQPFPTAPQPAVGGFPAAATQPAAAAAPPMTPSWRGLKSGFGTPVTEFVGTLQKWGVNPNQYGAFVAFDFGQCQILASESPYPYPDVTVEIKYSEAQSSAWGKAGAHFAEALGVDINALNIDNLVGLTLHMYRYDVNYGNDRATGTAMVGKVWRCVSVSQAGAPIQQITGTASEVPVGGIAAPGAPPATVAAAAPIAAAPVIAPTQPAVNSVVAETPAQPVQPAQSPEASLSAEQTALGLLDGKNLADFFAVAIPNEVIRADASVNTAVLSGAFVESQKAAGTITVDADGVHHLA